MPCEEELCWICVRVYGNFMLHHVNGRNVLQWGGIAKLFVEKYENFIIKSIIEIWTIDRL